MTDDEMTDDQMDARLHRAGQRWRASEPATATSTETAAPALRAPSPTATTPARRPHRRVGLLASAALVAAALVAGGAFLLNHTRGNGNTAATAPLAGTVWRLVAYDAQPPRATSLATLYIDDHGQFLADDGCTLVTASAGTSGGRLHLGAVEPRYYGCTDSGGALTFDRGLPT